MRSRSSGAAVVLLLVWMAVAMGGCRERSAGGKPKPNPRPFAGHTLRVATFGGSILKQLDLYAGGIFRDMTGADIKWIKGTSRIHVKTMLDCYAEGKPVPFDVVTLDDIVVGRVVSCGLVEKVDAATVPNLADTASFAQIIPSYAYAFQVYSVGIFYLKQPFEKANIPAPEDWSAFWKYPQLKGHIAVPDVVHTACIDFIVAVARLMGKDPYDIDNLRAAIAKIAALEPVLVFRKVGSLHEALKDEKVWIAPLYNSRAVHYMESGMEGEFVLPPDEGFVHYTTIVMTRGCREKELARMFMNLVFSPAYQLAQSFLAPFGPVNEKVFEPMAYQFDFIKRFPFGDEIPNLYRIDMEKIAELRPMIELAWREYFPREKYSPSSSGR